MWKKIALVSLGVWLLTLGFSAYFFIKGAGKTGDDGRLAVTLAREERNLVLAEMRQLLAGVQTILEAITNNDMKVVERTASSLGMKAAADVNPALMAKLPLDFKSTGMSVHGRFDELSLKVHGGMGKDEVLKEVSDIMLTCVGCHQAYRLDEADE